MADLPRELFQFYPIHAGAIVTLKNRRVWKIISQEGCYICKALDFPLAETAFIIDAMNHLAEMGFCHYNMVFPTIDGASFVTLEQRHYFLSKEIEGAPPSFSREEDTAAVGAFLGEFHQAAAGYQPQSPYEGRMKWGLWPEILEGKCREMKDFGEREDPNHRRFSLIYRRHLPYFLEDAEASAEFFWGQKYQTQWRAEEKQGGFCHHDMAYHNFIQGDSLFLIDFDYALADIRCHDIAQLLLKILKENHWEIHGALKALEEYDKTSPLSKEEPKIILEMLRFPQDFWQVAFARYEEHSEDPRLERKLDHWVLRRGHRKRALEALAREL
ncbi:MAG: CotS family spore coat protein [Bacillota bacterium]|nr:CotS family spore coat protein [Bacillota bacterium]